MPIHMLHLLRHAKSSWKNDIDDHERPLNRRGRNAARHIGKNLAEAVGPIDLVLCSSAVRGQQTWDLASAEYRLSPLPRCSIEDGLYLASQDKLFERLQVLAEDDSRVLVVGHNPGLHELAVSLADPASPGFRALSSGKFPTGCRASFQVLTPWSVLGSAKHKMIDYVTPLSLGAGKD